MIRSVLASVLLLAPVAALAQTAPSAPAATATDAATLVIARRVSARLLPPGVYKRIMSTSMDAVMANMGDALKAMPLRQIAEMGGMTADQAQALGKIDLEQVMAIYDPHWQERQQLTMHAMFEAMGDFFTTMEPDLREGMAHAYAARFSAAELADLDRYFGTPTGAKFAAGSTTIMTDPAVMNIMKDLMPKLVQQMPAFMAAAKKATAGLPPPRTLETLSAAERARLAKALGVDEKKLRDPKSAL